VTLDVAPERPGRRRAAPAPESLTVKWRHRTCQVELHGPVTARSFDQLTELLQGVGPAAAHISISLADAVVPHQLSAELLALSRRLAGDGATLEVRFRPATPGG
jgi:hypothetical protein